MVGIESRIESRTIEVEKPSLEEIIEENADYLDWLQQAVGPEARENYVAYLGDFLEAAPPTRVHVPVVMVQFGVLSIWSYTTPIRGFQNHPILSI